MNQDHDKEKWYYGTDVDCYVFGSEQDAINSAIDSEAGYLEEGETIIFKVGKCSHPVDAIGNCGESVFLNMLEKCDDEIGGEEASFDMNSSDITALGNIIKKFIRKNSKVNIWYCNDPEAKEYTHILGEQTG